MLGEGQWAPGCMLEIGWASGTSNQKNTFQVEKKNLSTSSHEPQKDNYSFHWSSWLFNRDPSFMVYSNPTFHGLVFIHPL